MKPAHKIPATVITGFLGAGKTTLIRHLIENANGRRIALIVNEFGDVGFDGEMLKSCGNDDCGEDDIVELANGCICCTVAEEFIPVMEKLLARETPPDSIVIETSGLALPQPLVRAFNWPEIKTRVTVDGVVTLVDAHALSLGRVASDEQKIEARRQADDMLDHETPLGELFEDQISCADLIVLNKTDLIAPDEAAGIEKTIREDARNGVSIIHARHGALPVDVIIGLERAAEDDDRKSHHDNGSGDHHDHDDFETFVIKPGLTDDPEILRRAIAKAAEGHGLLRIKGFAAVNNKPMRLVVQAVGPRVETYYDREWREGEARETSLVIIGETGLDREAVIKCIC